MIYGLYNKDTGHVRYVGRTCKSAKRRLISHKSDARTGRNTSPVGKWISNIGEKRVGIKVLEKNPDDEAVDEVWWMKYMKFLGCDLLNVAEYEMRTKKSEVPKELFDYLGKVPDTKLADRFGLTREIVRSRREARNISSVNQGSNINLPSKCIDQLGKKPDNKLAEEYGVSARTICERRKKHNIPPYKESQWNSNEKTGEVKWLAKNSDMTYEEIGEIYDISDANVSNIKNEKRRADVNCVKPDWFGNT